MKSDLCSGFLFSTTMGWVIKGDRENFSLGRRI